MLPSGLAAALLSPGPRCAFKAVQRCSHKQDRAFSPDVFLCRLQHPQEPRERRALRRRSSLLPEWSHGFSFPVVTIIAIVSCAARLADGRRTGTSRGCFDVSTSPVRYTAPQSPRDPPWLTRQTAQRFPRWVPGKLAAFSAKSLVAQRVGHSASHVCIKRFPVLLACAAAADTSPSTIVTDSREPGQLPHARFPHQKGSRSKKSAWASLRLTWPDPPGFLDLDGSGLAALPLL